MAFNCESMKISFMRLLSTCAKGKMNFGFIEIDDSSRSQLMKPTAKVKQMKHYFPKYYLNFQQLFLINFNLEEGRGRQNFFFSKCFKCHTSGNHMLYPSEPLSPLVLPNNRPQATIVGENQAQVAWPRIEPGTS